MFCRKCGNEIKEHDMFCSNCGQKNENGSRRVNDKTNDISKTFKAKKVFFPKTSSMVTKANDWLKENPKISCVKLHLHIEEGMTQSLTLTCKEQENNSNYLFYIEYIEVLKKSISGIFQYLTRPKADRYLENWRSENKGVDVLFERIVTYHGTPSEIFILCRKKINE